MLRCRVQWRAEIEVEQKPLPLVLLPGTLCDARIFTPLLDRLPGITACVLDCSHATSLQQAARHVLAQVSGPFALLGFSLGGMVAMEVALQAPERTCGLALLSTTALPVPAARHAARRMAVATAGTMAMEAFVRTHLWPEYAGDRDADASLQDVTSQTLMEAMATSLGQNAFHRQTEMALHRPDYLPGLRGLRCPALVIAGTADRLCPPEAQRALQGSLQGSTLHMLEGAGHLALLQRPDEVARAVAAWFHTVLQQGRRPGAVTARQESE